MTGGATTDEPRILGVVGAGTMGAGIAQVALEAGWHVRIHDPFPGATDRGRTRIDEGLARRAAKAGLDRPEALAWVDERRSRLAVAASSVDASDGAELVIEAIVEDLEAKRALFAAIDAEAPLSVILATNTSALSVTAIAEAAAGHPDRVLGLHFFNPAPVLSLVEVVAGKRTAPSALPRASEIVTAWGKTPVRSTDSPGFIVNRVNRPFTIQALRMLEMGSASVDRIDTAVRADGFPMGPFELMDLVGIDVNLAAARAIWEGLGKPPHLMPSPIQEWLVSTGRLGRKTNVGFYRYDQSGGRSPEAIPTDLARAPREGLPSAWIGPMLRKVVCLEALMVRDAGVASEADIDTALRLGAAHPEGPFEWMRRTGEPFPERTIAT